MKQAESGRTPQKNKPRMSKSPSKLTVIPSPSKLAMPTKFQTASVSNSKTEDFSKT